MPGNVLQKRICAPPTLVKQIELYNAFHRLEGYGYDWTMMLDDDEYLVLRGSGCRTLGEFAQKQDWYVSAFPWVYYGGREDPGRAGDRSTLLRRFKWRSSRAAGEVKIAFASKRLWKENRLVEFVNPHILKHGEGYVVSKTVDGRAICCDRDPDCQKIDVSKHPFVAHFYAKTPEEFAEKCARGRPDTVMSSEHQYFRPDYRPKMLEARTKADQNDVFDPLV